MFGSVAFNGRAKLRHDQSTQRAHKMSATHAMITKNTKATKLEEQMFCQAFKPMPTDFYMEKCFSCHVQNLQASY